jgi:hypothetical protein
MKIDDWEIVVGVDVSNHLLRKPEEFPSVTNAIAKLEELTVRDHITRNFLFIH